MTDTVLVTDAVSTSAPVEARDGAAYLAIKTQVPIVPVGIGGSERVMPKGSKIRSR